MLIRPKRLHTKGVLSFLAAFMCLFCCGCDETSVPAGIVATVNGEPVELRALQTLLDSRSASLGIPPRPSLEDMHKNYAGALGTIIAHVLVRQDLEARGLAVTQKDLDEEIRQINEDFGEDSLEQFLVDSSIRRDDWHKLLRDYLSLELFKNEVLVPGIEVGLGEIRNYYETHKADFKVPESFTLCFLTADSKEAMEIWCGDINTAIQSPEITAQCIDTPAREVPAPWNDEIKKLKAPSCAKPKEENGQWRSVALIGHEKGRELGLSEVYALIEKILIEQKQEAAFQKWLEQKIAASRILIAPELNNCLSLPETGQINEQ